MNGTRLLAGSALLLCACRAPSGRASPEDCAPATSVLPSGTSAEGLAGKYRLRLIATSGAKAGTTVEGPLALRPQSEELRYRVRPGGTADTSVQSPLFGTVDLDLDAVDAVSVGSTTSSDPLQPGVLVIEQHRRDGETPTAEITMRLGSEANRRDRQRFDGGYTVLRVRETDPERLKGSWTSGVATERSAGYFCAVRMER